MAKGAHELCEHGATSSARAKCRSVRKGVAELEAVRVTGEDLAGMIGQQVIGWRTEDTPAGPVLHRHRGILDRSYQHREGFTVWIVVSDEKPQGTGHLAAFVHVVTD